MGMYDIKWLGQFSIMGTLFFIIVLMIVPYVCGIVWEHIKQMWEAENAETKKQLIQGFTCMLLLCYMGCFLFFAEVAIEAAEEKRNEGIVQEIIVDDTE